MVLFFLFRYTKHDNVQRVRGGATLQHVTLKTCEVWKRSCGRVIKWHFTKVAMTSRWLFSGMPAGSRMSRTNRVRLGWGSGYIYCEVLTSCRFSSHCVFHNLSFVNNNIKGEVKWDINTHIKYRTSSQKEQLYYPHTFYIFHAGHTSSCCCYICPEFVAKQQTNQIRCRYLYIHSLLLFPTSTDPRFFPSISSYFIQFYHFLYQLLHGLLTFLLYPSPL